MKLFQNKIFLRYAPFLFIFGVILVFFYKTIVSGLVPFPGDILLAQYAPWRHVSYGGYIAGTVPTKNQYFDVVRELYPWKTLVVDEIKKGNVPLWNPYNFSGSPLLANYQSQVFYPLTILYLLLPQIIAWTVLVIIQPLLGSIFVYLFATEIGISAIGALLAAVLFNFSGFSNVWMEFTTVGNTIIWLPLLLFLVERAIKQTQLSLKQQLLFMFALFSSMTAGHPQDFINCFIFFGIYSFIRLLTKKDYTWKNKLLFMIRHVFIIVIPFLLAAPQLLPTIEFFQNSARVTHDYKIIITQMLLQWWQFPLFFVPDFFGNPATNSNFTNGYVGKTISIGTVGIFLAIASLYDKIKSWHKTFFIASAGIILLLTFRSPVSELFFRYPLPILSTGTPTRNLFLLLFSLSILAGFGYDHLKQKTISLKLFIPTLCVCFIICWGFALLHPNFTDISYTGTALVTMKRAMIFGTAFLTAATFVLIASRFKKILLLFMVLICLTELFYGFIKFNSFVPTEFVFPQNKLISYLTKQGGINRFWGYGTAAVEANFATQEKLFSPDGTDPLNLSWYNQFLQTSTDGNIPNTFSKTTRSDAKLAPGYGMDDLPNNLYRLRVMDMLGVKYVIDRSENPKNNLTFPLDRFKPIWHEDDWTVFENLMVAPRYFLTSDVRGYENNQEFEKQFFAPDFNPKKTILMEHNQKKLLPPLYQSDGTVSLVSYAPSRVLFKTNTDSPQMLFLSDTYDSGWEARINGKKSTIIKTNYAFRSVLVPKGQSTIELIYNPQSFRRGILCAGIAICLTFLYVLVIVKSKKTIR